MASRPRDTTIADEWRKSAISPHCWSACKNQTGLQRGEAGGYKVEAPGVDRVCYLKPADPRPDEHNHCRAAREKVASDLAFDLGLCVPPAQLTIRENPPTGCTRQVVVSLIEYPRQWTWSKVKLIRIDDEPAGLALAQALSRCSPHLAFDTWLDQKDHNDHPDNIVWGYDPGTPGDSSIIFLDYANSMGFDGSWAGNGWRQTVAPQWMPLMKQHMDRTALRRMIEKIERFPEDGLRKVVERIPDEYLPASQKGIILNGLIGRRGAIRAALAAEVQPTGE